MDPAKDRSGCSYLWVPTSFPPLALIVISDDVPGAADSPVAERLQEGRIHPPHGAALSVFGVGGNGPLYAHIRILNSLFLLPHPILLDIPVT